MTRILSLLLLALLGTQSNSALKDPPLTDERAVALVADIRDVENKDVEVRRKAAGELLDLLVAAVPATLPPGEVALYLMECGGQGSLPVSLDATWERLGRQWPAEIRESVLATLREQPDTPKGLLAGAAQAAGALRLSDWETLDALSRLLERREAGAAARQALKLITWREFFDAEAFRAWAAENRDRPRERWLEDRLRAEELVLVEHCRARLDARPADAWKLLEDPLREVRRIVYEKLAALTPSENEEQRETERKALEAAFYREKVPSLRARLVLLIPRYFQGDRAGTLLDISLRRESEPAEQAEAATALMLLEPREKAAEMVLDLLDLRIYPEAREEAPAGPGSTPAFRRALLNSLEGLADDADPERVHDTLTRALQLETDRSVKDKVFDTAGGVAGLEFMPVLKRHFRAEGEGPVPEVQDRIASLGAMTRIARRWLDDPANAEGERPAEISGLVADIKSVLGAKEEPFRYRAIQSAAILRQNEVAEELAARLLAEEAPFLKKEILKAFEVLRGEHTVSRLMDFYQKELAGNGQNGNGEAKADLKSQFLAALRYQIGDDLVRLQEAVRRLGASEDYAAAFTLVESARRISESPEAKHDYDNLYLRCLTEWQMRAVKADPAASHVRAEDAIGRLQDRIALEPENPEWPRLLGKLHESLGDMGKALEAYMPLMGMGADARQRWDNRLLVGEAAMVVGRFEVAEKALELVEPVPESLQFLYDDIQSKLLEAKNRLANQGGEQAAGEAPAPGTAEPPQEAGKDGGEPPETPEGADEPNRIERPLPLPLPSGASPSGDAPAQDPA